MERVAKQRAVTGTQGRGGLFGAADRPLGVGCAACSPQQRPAAAVAGDRSARKYRHNAQAWAWRYRMPTARTIRRESTPAIATHRAHDGVECLIDLAPVRRLAAPHPAAAAEAPPGCVLVRRTPAVAATQSDGCPGSTRLQYHPPRDPRRQRTGGDSFEKLLLGEGPSFFFKVRAQ